MKRKFIKCLCIAGLMMSQTAFAANSVFEDFSGALSLHKFSKGEKSTTLDTTNQNLVMTSKAKAYSGRIGATNWQILRDKEITMLQADLKVTNITLGNSNTQKALLRIAGSFYTAGDTIIFVVLNLGERGNGLEAWYEMYADDANSSGSTLLHQGVLEQGSLALNTAYKASITYDGNTTFSFKFNNGSTIVVDGPARTGETFRSKLLGTRVSFGHDNSTPNDVSDGNIDDGTAASIVGVIDNVTTDKGLYDDFSTASLNTNDKWVREEAGTELTAEGKVQLFAKQSGTGKTTEKIYLPRNLNYVGAKVTLLGGSTIKDGVRLEAFIQHVLGNTKFNVDDENNGQDGNIVTRLLIQRKNGELRAVAWADLITNEDWTSWEPIFWEKLSTTIALDQEYSLAISQSDKIVEYSIDGEVLYTLDLSTVSTNLYPAIKGTGTSIAARVRDDAGEVHALFDDVTTDLSTLVVDLNGENENGSYSVVPKKLIANVSEKMTLDAKADNPDDVLTYVWEQIAGTAVTVGTPEARSAEGTDARFSSRIVGSDSTFTFTIPEGADKETLGFKVTVVANSGLETSKGFEVEVDNDKTSTLSPSISTPPETSSSGGGTTSPISLLLLAIYFGALRIRRKVVLNK